MNWVSNWKPNFYRDSELFVFLKKRFLTITEQSVDKVALIMAYKIDIGSLI